jgi:hyperosmotically inducible periplasmic protein
VFVIKYLRLHEAEEDLMKAKLLVFPAVLLLASAAWGQSSQTPVPPQAEERIQREVRHQLLLLPYLTVFDNLGYRVQGYNVTLMGQVTRPVLKSDAENVVKHIEGVEKVDNQIEVLPTSPMDDGLRRRLFVAIYGYPSLEKYAMPVIKPIRIIIKNGHVTLEGVVDSESDKNTAGIRANSVPGIFSVNNNLQVVKQ